MKQEIHVAWLETMELDHASQIKGLAKTGTPISFGTHFTPPKRYTRLLEANVSMLLAFALPSIFSNSLKSPDQAFDAPLKLSLSEQPIT